EQEVQYAVVSPADDSGKEVVEAIWMCQPCHDFKCQEAPDTDFRDFVEETTTEPAKQSGLLRALGKADGTEQVDEDPEIGLPMELVSGEEVGHLIEESFQLLTKTEFESKVYSKVSASVTKKRAKKDMAVKFKEHVELAFRGFVKKVVGATGVGVLTRYLSTFDEIAGKQAPNEETPVKGSGAASSGPAEAAGSDGRATLATRPLLAITDAATPEGEGEDGKPGGDLGEDFDDMESSPSVEIGMPQAPLPPKRPQSFSTAPLGTAKHWIDRSPLEDVLLGAECKRELNQLPIIEKSKESPPVQRDSATRHISLTRNCYQLQGPNFAELKRERKAELLELVKPSIQSWPTFTQFNLIVYDAAQMWQSIRKAEGQRGALQEVCRILQVWHRIGDNVTLDISAPTVRASTMADHEKAGCFLKDIFVNTLIQWFQDGSDAEEAIYYVARNAPKYLGLQEDAETCEIGPACAQALSDCERILAVIDLMSLSEIPETTGQHTFDDIDLFVRAQKTAGAQDIWSVVARATNPSLYWQQKVNTLKENAKICKHFFPDLARCAATVEAIQEAPSQDACDLLAEAATKLEYFEKEIGQAHIARLADLIMQKFTAHAGSMPTSGSTPEEVSLETALVEKYIELAQVPARVAPLEDRVQRARDLVAQAKAALTAKASQKKASTSIELFKSGSCSADDLRNAMPKLPKSAGGHGDDEGAITHDAKSIIETIIRKPLDSILADAKNLAALAKEAKQRVHATSAQWASSASTVPERVSDLLDAVTRMGNTEGILDAVISQSDFPKRMTIFGRALKEFTKIPVPSEDSDGPFELHQAATEWYTKHVEIRDKLTAKHLEMLTETAGNIKKSIKAFTEAGEVVQFKSEVDGATEFKAVKTAFTTTIASVEFADWESAIQGL
ncbi:unnamed protein product, partial [Prorocentrum cordatum]